jgi:hypothetical protein
LTTAPRQIQTEQQQGRYSADFECALPGHRFLFDSSWAY